MPDPESVEIFDAQLKILRSSISDLGHEADSKKALTAAALGGGVFLLLLAIGAGYDLIAHKGGTWLTLGVTRETLTWTACALGGGAIVLLLFGFMRVSTGDTGVDARLDQMEQQYAELLECRDAVARSRS